MSVLLKAILNAHALEHDRIRNAAAQIIANAPLVNRGIITVPTPSEACVVDAVNAAVDPQGLGVAGHWGSDGPGYAPAVLADAPVAYWRLAETSGGAAADQTGANPGTYVGSRVPNLLVGYIEPGFRTIAGVWTATNCGLAGAGGIAGSLAFPPATGGAQLTRGGAAADMDIHTFNNAATRFPVTVGTTYTASAYVQAKTVARGCQVQIDWLDSSGAVLSSSPSAPVNDVVGSWTQLAVTGTAPTGAVTAGLLLRVQVPGSAEVHYFDAVQVTAGATLQPWSGSQGLVSMNGPVGDLAVQLDASYISVPDAPGLRLPGAWSVEFWVWYSSILNPGLPLLCKGVPVDFRVLLTPTGPLQVTTPLASQTSLALHPTPNAWSHVVVTCNGFSGGVATIVFYVNGVSNTTTISGPLGSSSGPLYIGYDPSVPTYMHSPTGVAKPRIDEVAIYNTTLSAARVLAHYNGASGTARVSAVRRADTPPAGWSSYQRAPGGASNVSYQQLTTVPAGPVYVYAFVRSDPPTGAQVVLQSAPGASGGSYATIATVPISQAGWAVVRFAVQLPVASRLIVAASATAPNALDLTGVTICSGFDPGGPFSGDSPDEFNYAYRWTGARNASPTNRHTTQFDTLSIAEREANVSIAPMSLTVAQRQSYLVERFHARHQPALGDPEHDTQNGVPVPDGAQVTVDHEAAWITGFKQQIGDVIRADGTPYDDNRTTVLVNAPNRSFTVQLAYSASGPLIDRINRLILDIKPGHLAYDTVSGLTAGGFLADFGVVGPPGTGTPL